MLIRTATPEKVRTTVKALVHSLWQARITVFHEFQPSPTGGGHQFMRALCGEFERRGLSLDYNRLTWRARACLFNSFNFDFERLKQARRPRGCRMVHRVDGPVGVYRGRDDGTDQRIWDVNRELADATVFQSQYSLNRHLELDMAFRNPTVIRNAVNAAIFHPRGRVPFDATRPIRLVSVSWSDNANKGADIYRWIEEHLDWSRFEYTFVGRSPIPFRRIRMLDPMPSEGLADELRQHDVYVTASRHDPCSNSLLEAQACGLPALYLNSGGHPEIAGEAGFAFDEPEQIPGLLDRLVGEYADRQARIDLPNLTDVTGRYLAVMGLVED